MSFQPLTSSALARGRAQRISRSTRFSYRSIGHIGGIADVTAIMAAAVLGDGVYKHSWLNLSGDIGISIGLSVIATFVYLPIARMSDLHRLPVLLNPGLNLGKLVAAWAISICALTTILFVFKFGSNISRGSFFTFAIFELPFLFTARLTAAGIVKRMIAHDAIKGRAAVLIGSREELASLQPKDLLHQFDAREICRVVLDSSAAGDTQERRLVMERAIERARQLRAEEFVIAVPWKDTDLLAEITTTLRGSPLPGRLLPDTMVRSISAARSTAHLHEIEIQRAPMSLVERGCKRVFDFVIALIALIALAPIFIATAMAVRLDSPGPVIFKQRRNGLNQNKFLIYKFRTMSVLEDGPQIAQATRDDPRVTRVGRWLRRTSIDELPQLLNVLKGDMSLVGPRPHALAHDDQYKRQIETYCWRHHVKPGLTGWAQVHGHRGETRTLGQMRQRIEYDVWYINNWSLLLDVHIMMRTCLALLKHEAY